MVAGLGERLAELVRDGRGRGVYSDDPASAAYLLIWRERRPDFWHVLHVTQFQVGERLPLQDYLQAVQERLHELEAGVRG